MRSTARTALLGALALGMTAGVAHAAPNLTTNPTFEDSNTDLAFGDGWTAFGAAGFDDFFAAGAPGHAVLFADLPGNLGGVFQTGLPAAEGVTYDFVVSVALEANFDAELIIGLEFYELDDLTQAGVSEIIIPLDAAGDGYRQYRVIATAPADSAFVRPVVRYDNVLSSGTQRAALVDNATLSVADPGNLLYNGGFEDWLTAGDFGANWGTFGAAGFADFFNNGNPGHAVLFGDMVANTGGFFQAGVPAEAGVQYLLTLDASFEAAWDARTQVGLEFYADDDSTKLGERLVEISEVLDAGYGQQTRVAAVAPAGTAFVRPVVLFDNVLSGGPDRGAVFDNARLERVDANTNIATNPGFLDLNEDLDFGDGWGTFGAVDFLDFFNVGNPGHGTLFGDNTANIGFLFQGNIPAVPGKTYELNTSVSFESEWDATTTYGLEFYAADDSTKLDETIVQITGPLGEGYRRYRVTGTAPAGAAYVRPIIFFDNVLSSGASRAAAVDNMSLTCVDDNLIENPGFEDQVGDGNFGDFWGTFDNVGFLDFFGNGNPGHAVFFADLFFNFGTLFQAGIPGEAGVEYSLSADVSFEDLWDARFEFGLEFYDADDATLLDSTIVEVTPMLGGGYNTYDMTATSPAGTFFVRPVFFFDFVASEGPMRAATIDNAVLAPTTVETCFADFTTDGTGNGIPDGLVTLSDFAFYLSLWSQSDPRADITPDGTCDAGNGSDGVTLSDFSCYLSEWSQPCP